MALTKVRSSLRAHWERSIFMWPGSHPPKPVGEVFKGKDIKTGPEMGSIRENGREFGHCAEVKSVSMGALRPYLLV
ncbi:MAG: hypothetical protein V7724_06005 [Sediminicola sp.]